MLELQEIKKLLEDERKTLIRAMIKSNEPMEAQLVDIRQELRELGETVANNSLRIERGDEKMDRFNRDILRLESHVYSRRKTDVDDIPDLPNGDDRKITVFHVTVFIGTVVATVAFLKLVGLLK